MGVSSRTEGKGPYVETRPGREPAKPQNPEGPWLLREQRTGHSKQDTKEAFQRRALSHCPSHSEPESSKIPNSRDLAETGGEATGTPHHAEPRQSLPPSKQKGAQLES